MQKTTHSLKELAQYLNAELKGDPDTLIHSIAPLDKAQAGQLSFLHDHYLADPKYKSFLSTTQASVVILSPKFSELSTVNQLIMDNPYLGYAKVAKLFAPKPNAQKGIHPTAVVGKNCCIAETACIGPHCVIGDEVVIGERTIVSAGCTIGDHSAIGADGTLYPKATLYHNIKIGDRVILQSGVVIGSDGFGMVNDNGTWYKIPQLGGVILGNDVEIGANTTIDRGALEDTVIGDGVKLDNQIQIGHNVRIGAHTVIAGCTGIAGSTEIGRGCMIGGAAMISGHIKLTDGVILTASAAVSSSILNPGIYSSGVPSQPNAEWRKNAVRFKQLDEMARRLKKLEQSQ
ncbi:MAG: UDP-3-O-(3-hydroxymyristoyl)glucosamine N-acyltransferase [Gammaproteobacteria bacterium]